MIPKMQFVAMVLCRVVMLIRNQQVRIVHPLFHSHCSVQPSYGARSLMSFGSCLDDKVRQDAGAQ